MSEMSVKWIFEIDREKCDGCGICIDECPVEAISLNDDNIAEIDAEECVECETCVDVCPKNAISVRVEKEDKNIEDSKSKKKRFKKKSKAKRSSKKKKKEKESSKIFSRIREYFGRRR